jgi:hypothetical protein
VESLGKPNDGSVSQSVLAFDDLIQGPLQVFLKHSNTVGGLVLEQALLLKEAFDAQSISSFHHQIT